jgi:hypothetical protein
MGDGHTPVLKHKANINERNGQIVQQFLEFMCLFFESIKWALKLDLAERQNLFRNRYCSVDD